MKSVIQRIATGPTLSKNINFEEAKLAMSSVLKGEIDDVQVAVFLIALRMKIETQEEVDGVLSAIIECSKVQKIAVDNLVDIGDPYSGYNRSIPISSFLPPLLAQLGLPTVIHGLDSVSPKYGLTHRHIMQSLGYEIDLSVSEVAMRIEDENIGWGYVDQKQYCQGLHNLVPIRNKIIKRTVINTVETLIAPIRGDKTHLVLGYVHKPYPPIYAQLAKVSGLDSSLLIRGVEGGVVPSLRQQGLMISYYDGIEKNRVDINPSSLGIKQDIRAISFPKNLSIENDIKSLADETVKLGKAALSGEQGVYYDGLVYAASLVLWHTKTVESLDAAADKVREVLNSGKTLDRL
ncbi:Anthranilate phosphoribosyltransferase [hydrothermal vent metagenome]|uniref:Anthranilate phosphoribosyltransferase n=1 Tax=hydrothermal vent metagenome TaxID=652676 RepID=A0A1W1BNP3_9ZZZZ